MTYQEAEKELYGMTDAQRSKFLECLKPIVDDETFRVVQLHVAFISMYSNPDKYYAMKDAVGEVLVKEFYGR